VGSNPTPSANDSFIGMHPVDAGLYPQILSINARSWTRRYTFNGKARWSGLGSYPGMTLAAAGARRDDERAQLRARVDPVAERKRLRGESTPSIHGRDDDSSRLSRWKPVGRRSNPDASARDIDKRRQAGRRVLRGR
jgi:hypothetical protein